MALSLATLTSTVVFASETLLDSYSESNTSASNNLNQVHRSPDGWYSAVGQTFKTPNNGKYFRISSAKFYIRKATTPTADLTANLYTMTGAYGTTGKPTGDALAKSAIVNAATLTTSYQLITFTFSSSQQYLMEPNTAYVIVIQADSHQIDTAKYVLCGSDSSGPTHAGNMAYYASSAWGAWSLFDVVFYVYGIENSLVTFYHSPNGAVLFNGVNRANGSSAYFNNGEAFLLAASPTNSSYVFLNFTYGAAHSDTNPVNYTVSSAVSIWAYFNAAVAPYIVARFSWSPSAPAIGEAVSFDGSISESSAEISSYLWAFGDGETDTGSTAVHSYTTSGAKTVTLTATSDAGSDDFSAYVVVGSGVSEVGPSGGSHVFTPAGPSIPWFVGQLATGLGAMALLEYLERKIRKIGPRKVKKRIHTIIKRAFTRRQKWDHVEN